MRRIDPSVDHESWRRLSLQSLSSRSRGVKDSVLDHRVQGVLVVQVVLEVQECQWLQDLQWLVRVQVHRAVHSAAHRAVHRLVHWLIVHMAHRVLQVQVHVHQIQGDLQRVIRWQLQGGAPMALRHFEECKDNGSSEDHN